MTSEARRDRDVIIVHTSDVHVDHDYTARANGGDGAKPLAVVLEAARAASADVVLLCGDTFDCHNIPLDLARRVGDLAREAEIRIVLLPGNHDPAIEEALWAPSGLTAIDTLHILGVTDDGAVVFEDLDLEVWGRPHRDYGDMIPLEFTRPRRTRWQIAMAHGHYEPKPDRSFRPRASWLIGDDEIEATRADYLALGHWNRAIRVGSGLVPAYYSGSPDYAKTVNIVRLTPAGEVEVERRPLACESEGGERTFHPGRLKAWLAIARKSRKRRRERRRDSPRRGARLPIRRLSRRIAAMIAPEVLLQGYRLGVFPMAMEDGAIEWFSPDPRGILPLGEFHTPHALAKVVRQNVFEIRYDTSFAAVMRRCAERAETWINREIIESYTRLHELGQAHSVEAWAEGKLVGGLYGVSDGGAFFGESMFHDVTDASKVALCALVERLRGSRFILLDTQWLTPHLQRFGGIEVSRRQYMHLLSRATALTRTF